MLANTVKVYAGVIFILAVIGIIFGDKLFLGFLNIDGALDVLRIAALFLLLNSLYGAVRGVDMQRMALGVVGVLFLGVGIWGCFNNTIVGLLPHHLTLFGKLFNIITGVIAVGVASGGLSTNSRRA